MWVCQDIKPNILERIVPININVIYEKMHESFLYVCCFSISINVVKEYKGYKYFLNYLNKVFMIFILLSYILKQIFLFLKFNVYLLIYYNLLLKNHWLIHLKIPKQYIKWLFCGNWSFYHQSSDLPVSKNEILIWMCDYLLS
jgi:hypothetical protein